METDYYYALQFKIHDLTYNSPAPWWNNSTDEEVIRDFNQRKKHWQRAFRDKNVKVVKTKITIEIIELA